MPENNQAYGEAAGALSTTNSAAGNMPVGAAKAQASGSAGSGSSKQKKSTGSNIKPVYGVRAVKEYPIQEQELSELFKIGLLATMSFSVASLLFSIFLDVFINLSLATGLPESKTFIWYVVAFVCLILSIFLAAFGGFFIYNGHTKIQDIKNHTAFLE